MNGYITNGDINYSLDDKEFFLPHQCDRWLIGNIELAKEFLADLQKTIDEVEQL
jgi:hypothetical protein